MSERDELRGTLSSTICNASNYTKRAQPHLMGSDMSTVLDKTADAILAAGYSKPRTITTAEEVDALPEKSIVMTRFGDGVTIYRDNPGLPFGHYHFLIEDGGHATVLHEPTA